jgi:hypothetical protein
MMFADASTLFAISTGEPEADPFADLPEAEPWRLQPLRPTTARAQEGEAPSPVAESIHACV